MRLLTPMLAAALAPAALAQTGTLDQTSPYTNASYNHSAAFLVWQQQAVCGIAGTLEGITFQCYGPIGSQCNIRIRLGTGWNTSPIVFTGTLTKVTPDFNETIFLNMTSASISLNVGDRYVIESFGNETGFGLLGSYVEPPGTPVYAEPLFLTGSLFSNGGWRHAFRSYVLAGAACCIDYNGDEEIDFTDIEGFLAAYNAQIPGTCAPGADINNDGEFDFSDIEQFLVKYTAGC